MLTQPSPSAYFASLPKRPLRILVACEFSGRVRDALIARGHDAISCDLLDTDAPGPHIQGDVTVLLRQRWDMILAFPPCTYLAASQLWRCLPHHDPEGVRWHAREESLRFVRAILNANAPRIVMENPVGCIGTRLFYDDMIDEYAIRSYADAEADPRPTLPYSQLIQPYEYGSPESKRTCLWLKNVPVLTPTNVLKIEEHGYFHAGEKCWRWMNQTGRGGNKLGETKDKTRWKIRSLTYSGIAAAMASQWTSQLIP